MKLELLSKKRFRVIIYACIILLAVTALGLYSCRLYSAEQNRKLLIGLSEDIKTLQTKFNTVQDGWEYDEYCRGVGGKFQKNNSITCTVEIENLNNNQSQQHRYDYVNIIDNSKAFVTKQPREVNSLASGNFSRSFVPIGMPESNCVLADIDDVDGSKKGLVFYCKTYDTKAFHFRKE